jgi:UDP-glucose 4-epimerase
MIPKPMSHYAVQKLASEHYCQIYHRLHGLETVCLRYFNVYGPRQRADSPYSGVIAKFIDAARAGQPITIFGDGEQTRDFCHVKDVASANYLAAKSPGAAVAGGTFNLGTGKSISVNDLAGIVSAAFGAPEEQPTHGLPRAAEIRHSRADICKSLQALAWQPVVSLNEYSIARCGVGL